MVLELKKTNQTNYCSCLTGVTDTEVICPGPPQEVYGLSSIQQVSNLKSYSSTYIGDYLRLTPLWAGELIPLALFLSSKPARLGELSNISLCYLMNKMAACVCVYLEFVASAFPEKR